MRSEPINVSRQQGCGPFDSRINFQFCREHRKSFILPFTMVLTGYPVCSKVTSWGADQVCGCDDLGMTGHHGVTSVMDWFVTEVNLFFFNSGNNILILLSPNCEGNEAREFMVEVAVAAETPHSSLECIIVTPLPDHLFYSPISCGLYMFLKLKISYLVRCFFDCICSWRSKVSHGAQLEKAKVWRNYHLPGCQSECRL